MTEINEHRPVEAPPLRPDVDIMDNSEGNDANLAEDRRSAEEYLKGLDPEKVTSP